MCKRVLVITIIDILHTRLHPFYMLIVHLIPRHSINMVPGCTMIHRQSKNMIPYKYCATYYFDLFLDVVL